MLDCCVTMGAISSGRLLSEAVVVLGIVKKPDAEFGYHSDAHMHSQIRIGEGTTHLPLKVSSMWSGNTVESVARKVE